jgi:hypothetical protein
MTEEEKQFWNREQGREAVNEKYAVGKYSMTEQELPAVMERNGFKDVSAGYAVVDLTPDNPKYSDQMAEDMINAERYCEIEAVQSSNLDGMDRMIEIINDKYDTRIELYRNGKRQWDTNTSITMIIRGINDK